MLQYMFVTTSVTEYVQQHNRGIDVLQLYSLTHTLQYFCGRNTRRDLDVSLRTAWKSLALNFEIRHCYRPLNYVKYFTMDIETFQEVPTVANATEGK